jgi:hypothetical protein
MGPAWANGASLADAIDGPCSGQAIDLGGGEDLIGWPRLQGTCDGQAVASALEERPGGAPLDRETGQERGSLLGEWTVAMTAQDGWRPEQLVEHDGILLRGIPPRSTYVVKSSMNPSICVLACGVWQRN